MLSLIFLIHCFGCFGYMDISFHFMVVTLCFIDFISTSQLFSLVLFNSSPIFIWCMQGLACSLSFFYVQFKTKLERFDFFCTICRIMKEKFQNSALYAEKWKITFIILHATKKNIQIFKRSSASYAGSIQLFYMLVLSQTEVIDPFWFCTRLVWRGKVWTVWNIGCRVRMCCVPSIGAMVTAVWL